MKYKSVYNQWRNDPEKYWQNLANDISWKVFPKTILNKKNEYLYEWFPDGILNTCYNAVDKNIVEGRGNQVAIYYCNENGETLEQFNPNGSIKNIAGIFNKEKNVLGMMPHPERMIDESLSGEDGSLFFKNLINNIK